MKNKNNTKPYRIAMEYFPNASEKELHTIIWDKTGFPFFFVKPEGCISDEQCFRYELQKYKESLNETN